MKDETMRKAEEVIGGLSEPARRAVALREAGSEVPECLENFKEACHDFYLQRYTKYFTFDHRYTLTGEGWQICVSLTHKNTSERHEKCCLATDIDDLALRSEGIRIMVDLALAIWRPDAHVPEGTICS